jgi:hypothetical protein
LAFLHVVVDVRTLEQTKERVLAVLNELSSALSFSFTDSGRGFHVKAWLKEPVEAGTADYERACRLRTAMTRVLCGDPANDHSAALLRVVGTTNYKCDPPAQCHVVEPGSPVSLDDIEAFLEMYPSPLFTPKVKTNGAAELAGTEPPKERSVDGPCAELNAAALRDFESLRAWVPALLPDAVRKPGRYPGYEAVNPSRPSKTGRPYEQRARHLSIIVSGNKAGIKDWGTGQGYSALDLVMAVRQRSLAEAFSWLEEKLPPQKPDVEVDWDKIVETQDAPTTAPEDAKEEDGVRVYGRIRLVLYDAIPPERLKRRMWLYRRHYLGGTVSSTVGDSGIGKTSLSLIEIVGLSIGRDLLGNEKLVPHRCW